MDFSVSTNRKAEVRAVGGGRPITYEEAAALRMSLTDSTIHTLSGDFRSSSFQFQNEGGPLPFGLVASRNGTHSIVLAVQAYVLRYLVFKYSSKEEINFRDVLHPNTYQRTQALVSSLTHMLWQAGDERQSACVCLPQGEACFHGDGRYRKDAITETLHIYDFSSEEELRIFIKRNMDFFEKDTGGGVLSFLYSLVLSRSIDKIRQDQGHRDIPLLTDSEHCSPALVNLMLTGTATPYRHNGEAYYDEDGVPLDDGEPDGPDNFYEYRDAVDATRGLIENQQSRENEPQRGVNERSEIGFLYWHRDYGNKCKHMVGSMLKTPKRPIWLTHVNGHWGLVFTLNPDLVNDWRSEHSFNLHYYTGLSTQSSDVTLTVDTRLGRQYEAKTERGKKEEDRKLPALEKAIMTKWYGSTVNWNGTVPFV